jgi:uncharacterized membrane-anchored protein
MNKNIQRGLLLVAGLGVSAAALADDPGVTAITALSTTAQTYITAAFVSGNSSTPK